MLRSPHVKVEIDLNEIRQNAQEIRQKTNVDLIAVLKADAYGHGAKEVAQALAHLANAFYFFNLTEVAAAEAHFLNKPILALSPPDNPGNPEDYLSLKTRPGVGSVDHARHLAKARPIPSLDTGMQRFAIPLAQIGAALDAMDGTDEAFTHATHPEQAAQLKSVFADRPNIRLHAAGTALLDDPSCYLDATRPGLALYRNAARVTTPIVEARDSSGPAGYSRFQSPRHGIILCGYSNALRPGPCLVNGRPSRLLEVGMQSAYVQLLPNEGPGAEVTLLGDSLTPATLAHAWQIGEHETLLRLTSTGVRQYLNAD